MEGRNYLQIAKVSFEVDFSGMRRGTGELFLCRCYLSSNNERVYVALEIGVRAGAGDHGGRIASR